MGRIALITLGWMVLIVGCGGGGGRFGYARQYEALDAEQPHYERAVQVSYEEVRREPEVYAKQTLAWFGTVTKIEKMKGGKWTVGLELRFHQPRHLCRDHSEDSCRVTVSSKVGGPYSATIEPHNEDMAGKYQLQVGALMKVYGTPTGEFDDNGGPIVDAGYYRHWPVGTFVSTGGAASMRR